MAVWYILYVQMKRGISYKSLGEKTSYYKTQLPIRLSAVLSQSIKTALSLKVVFLSGSEVVRAWYISLPLTSSHSPTSPFACFPATNTHPAPLQTCVLTHKNKETHSLSINNKKRKKIFVSCFRYSLTDKSKKVKPDMKT